MPIKPPVAIQNARLYEQVQQYAAELESRVAERTFELQVLLELSQSLGQATHYRDILRLILLHLYQAIPYDVAASLLLGEDDQANPLMLQSQRPLTDTLEVHLKEIMRSSLEQIRGEPLDSIILDVHRIQGKSTAVSYPPLENLDSLMQALIFIDDIPMGILLVAKERAKQFGIEHANLLRTIANGAAESLQRLRSLLVAEHRRLEALVAHLPDGVILLDTNYRIVLTNQIAQIFLQILGWDQTSDRLTHLATHPMETILNTISSNIPYEIKTAGSSPHIFEIMAKPMAVGPEAGGWTVVIRDVTQEQTTQRQIRQQEQLALVGQLAAGIAHDFNNILTSIIGFSELLLAQPEIPATAKQDLIRITKQGQRAARLVGQILDFSRQSITEKRPLDIVSFLKETVRLLERTLSETIEISLDIETDSTFPILNADLAQFQQGLTNLAINARDAMPEGGTLRFHLYTADLASQRSLPALNLDAGQWIILSVSDTGTGIPPEIVPHIFEPFFTTKEVGEGTGLGLAQVYGIVRQHGGDIEVESTLDQGTTFTLYLPVSTQYQMALSPQETIDIPHGWGEVILVVEDDIDVLEVAKAMLERLGYRVLTALDGQAALQVYDQHCTEIALVLSDLTMPKMGGIELITTLRERNTTIKFVTMTGYPLKGQAKELLQQGFVEWLHKPLSIEKLAHTVHRLLN